MSLNKPKPKPFFQQHILPVLFVFLIPGFSAWFFSYAETTLDQEMFRQIQAELDHSSKISSKEKTEFLEFYRRVPVSRIMASNKPQAAKVQAAFASVRFRYATFRWMKRTAWVCLGTLAATFLIVGLSVAFSFRSHAAQYRALCIGWPVLRSSAGIQVLGQGALAVALSFWVTVLFGHVYIPKLIAIAAILALTAVVTLWKAIFARVDRRFELVGEILKEEEAPKLWGRIRELAVRLNTSAPDRIVAGVAPSFFVTENPVMLDGETLNGRTLYLSLPMLRVLATDEADAVLGHELAHFSGQDTFWSLKIAPLTGKFALYIQMLAHGLSSIVAHFMLLFWKLYSLSISKLSRAREFRADQIGAECTSKTAMKQALVKVTSYCEYRAERESDILKKERVDKDLDLASTLEFGYPTFLAAFVRGDKSVKEVVPHPFDSHPTLDKRLAQLGFEAHTALANVEVPASTSETWFGEITDGAEREKHLWDQRQQFLLSAHSQNLAWRLLPKDDEEKAIVQEHFPPVVFRNKKGVEATLQFDRIHLPSWENPILFKDIISAKLEAGIPHKRLRLVHHKEDRRRPVSTKFYPGAFKAQRGNLLAVFSFYFSRHKTAELKNRSQENAACAEAAAVST